MTLLCSRTRFQRLVTSRYDRIYFKINTLPHPLSRQLRRSANSTIFTCEMPPAGTQPRKPDAPSAANKEANEYIPSFISKKPFYIEDDNDTDYLEHQRLQKAQADSKWYDRGKKAGPAATKFRKGKFPLLLGDLLLQNLLKLRPKSYFQLRFEAHIDFDFRRLRELWSNDTQDKRLPESSTS